MFQAPSKRGAAARALCLVGIVTLAGCSGQSKGPRPGLNVADEALRNGSPQIALQVALGILARSPDDVPALLVQGDAATQLGNNADASTAFTRVLKLEPNSVHAKIGLGRVRLTTEPAEAEALFQDAVRLDPGNINALNNLGIARDLQGRHREAQEAYRQVRASHPGNTAALVNLALSLAMSGDSASAIQIMAPLADEPGATMKVRHDYAAVLAMAGREADAETILSRDLSPPEVRQVLEAFRQQRGNAAPAVNPVSLSPDSDRPASKATQPRRPAAVRGN